MLTLLAIVVLGQGCKSDVQQKYEELTSISLDVVKLRSINKTLQQRNRDIDAVVLTKLDHIDNLVDSLQILLVNATGGYSTPRKGDMATEFRDARNMEATTEIFSNPETCKKLQSAVTELLLSTTKTTYSIPEASYLFELRSEFTKGNVCQLLQNQTMIDGMILLGKFNLWSQLHQKQLALDNK